jgi:hypothetical protein
MVEKPMTESVNAEGTGDPVPAPRAGEPEPGAADQPAKAAKRAKATKAARSGASKAAGRRPAAGTPADAEAAKAPATTSGTAKKAVKKAAKKAAGGTPAKRTAAEGAKAAKADKPTAAKQASPAPRKAPEQATQPTPPPEPDPPAPLVPAHPGAWLAAVREAVSRPDQPPQRLAELLVAELGPRAAAWAGWLRETYPDPPAHGMARLAGHEATQLTRALVLADAAGQAAPALLMAGTFWVRATVVLRIAAAYGHAPTDPRRAGDLVELLDLHPGDESPKLRRFRLLASAASTITGRRTPVQVAARALLRGGIRGYRIEQLTHRAVRFYRAGSQDSTSATSASISSPNRP